MPDRYVARDTFGVVCIKMTSLFRVKPFSFALLKVLLALFATIALFPFELAELS